MHLIGLEMISPTSFGLIGSYEFIDFRGIRVFMFPSESKKRAVPGKVRLSVIVIEKTSEVHLDSLA